MFITAFPKPKTDKAKGTALDKEVNEKLFDLLQLTCHICACPYDAVEKIPMIICPEQHTYCAICVNELLMHRPNTQRCPSCRAFLCKNSAYVNKTLLRICDIVPLLANEFTSLANENKAKKEELHKLEK
jgi:hypothetical protein